MHAGVLDWVRSECAKQDEPREFEPLVTIAEYENMGRGLQAIHDIKSGDLLLEIPGSLILSSLNFRFSPMYHFFSNLMYPSWMETGKITNKEDGAEDMDEDNPYKDTMIYSILHSPFICTVFLLMYERHNVHSHWKEMIKLMPTEKENMIFWSKEELANMQYSSFPPDDIQYLVSSLEVVYSMSFEPTLEYYPQHLSHLTQDDFKWAITAIWSRGYWLDKDDTFPGLLPVADMFNHCANNNRTDISPVHYYYDEISESFKIYTNRDYKMGEQVWSDYGNKSNAEWLADYGMMFTDNPWNKVRIHVPLTPDTPQNIPFGSVCEILHLGANADLSVLQPLRVALLSQKERAQMKSLEWTGESISLENEIQTVQYLLQVFYQLLLNEETKLALKQDGLKNYRQYLVSEFVLEEQKLLAVLIDEYQQYLEYLVPT